MSKQKHTLGPWNAEYDREPEGFEGYWAVWGAYGAPVAKINPDMDEAAEAKANAHLIAAAPDLLASLKELTAVVQWAATDTSIIDRANAAIAKAEGRVE